MALREVSGFTTQWRKNESAGDVSIGYEVNGQEMWSVLRVGSRSEFTMLVDLLGGQSPALFDDEENYLRTRAFTAVNEGDSVESLIARGATSSVRRSTSRSATDVTNPRCLTDSEWLTKSKPKRVWTGIERR